MPNKPITQRANGNITPKKGPGDGLKPGEKAVPSTYRPFNLQGGIKPGSIQKMTPADTMGYSKPGYRVDLNRSMKAFQGGSDVYQPAYIKLAPGSGKKVTGGTKATTTTTTKPANTKPATTTTKPVEAPAKKQEAAPKERTAMRMQTIIDEKGNKTFKNVVYSKYQPGKGWVLTGTPLVIDKRKKP
jgi:hypothetical protein